MVFGLENFWCGSLLLPQNVCSVISKLCKQLFWGYQEWQRKPVFKSWASICSPWSEGGFQVKDLTVWNQASMLKWLWHLVHGSGSVWTEWIRKYFLANTSIWDLQIHEYHSECLRNILTARDILINHCGNRQDAIVMLDTCITNGKFSVGKAYNLLRPRFPIQACYKAVQNPFILARHKFILMMALQRKLATADQFCRRGFSLANRCYLCKQHAKSTRHLFFYCPYSQAVLSSLLTWMGLHLQDLQLRSLILWTHRRKAKHHWKNRWFKCSLAAATYYLWKERNYRIFENKERQPQCLIREIKLCFSVLVLHKSPNIVHDELLGALNV